MRRINLLLSTLIGIVGMIIYFVSIPTVNEEHLVEITVEAGDEQLLENVYFSGYLDNYSEFYIDYKETKTLGNLSYLEKLDAPYNIDMFKLQEAYPDLIDPLIYDMKVSGYSVLNGENALISSHIKYNKENYYLDNSQIYLNHLNKETMELKEEIISRDVTLEGDLTQIIGMYEDYPAMKIVYVTSFWNNEGFQEESVLSLGEYNFETKNYSEARLLTEDGSFYPYDGETQVFMNKNRQLFAQYGASPDGEQVYSFDYIENTLTPLDNEEKYYTIGNESQLYSLEFTDGETLLTQYNESAEEVIHEVNLSNPISLNLYGEDSSLLTEVIDGKLYVVQNHVNYEETQEMQPSELQLFDIETGQRLLNGYIHFDETGELDTRGAGIHTIGQRSDH